MAALRVGALFEHDASGNHFCTASVVSSPGKDLLITAAHCIHGGKGSGYRSDIVFIPGYRDGQEPFGVWTPARLIVAPQLADSSDPDFDVGFVVLQPNDGRTIEQVLGANRLMADTGYRYLVHVTTRSRTGTIVGVIGGYQQGGDTDAVSYSVRLGAAIVRLYRQAAGPTG